MEILADVGWCWQFLTRLTVDIFKFMPTRIPNCCFFMVYRLFYIFAHYQLNNNATKKNSCLGYAISAKIDVEVSDLKAEYVWEFVVCHLVFIAHNVVIETIVEAFGCTHKHIYERTKNETIGHRTLHEHNHYNHTLSLYAICRSINQYTEKKHKFKFLHKCVFTVPALQYVIQLYAG